MRYFLRVDQIVNCDINLEPEYQRGVFFPALHTIRVLKTDADA